MALIVNRGKKRSRKKAIGGVGETSQNRKKIVTARGLRWEEGSVGKRQTRESNFISLQTEEHKREGV